MSSNNNNDNERTPSWKVNLTHKFNQFCKTKNTHPKTITNTCHPPSQPLTFEDELEQQLKSIPVHRDEFSSHKKHLTFRQEPQKNISNSNTNSALQIHSTTYNQQYKRLNQSKLHSHLNHPTPTIQKLSFDSSSKLQQSQQETSYLFTNKKLAKLFKQYFHHRESIELKEFVDMCCIEFLKQQSLSAELKDFLLHECRSIFCTTDDSLISLNALELVTKKNDLQVVIVEKYLQAKYIKKKKQLQKQYQDILVEILNQQDNLKQEHDKLAQRKKQIEAKEKELLKKQKYLKSQEKQLHEKQKTMKKTLEDKHSKLTIELNHQFESLTKQLQKKSNALERNARNKLQLLEKRSNDLKVERLNHQIPEKDWDDQGSKKLQNEILLLKSRLRKVEKQFEGEISEKLKEINKLQSESNSLLKANTLLENKLQKTKTKSKELNELLARQGSQLEQVKRQLDQKGQRIAALQNFALQFQHQQQKTKLKQVYKPHKQQKSHSKADSKSQHKQTQRNAKDYSQNSKKISTQNIQQIINKVNHLLGLVLKGFANQSLSSKQSSNQLVKIEEVLLDQAEQVIQVCLDLLWTAIEYSAKPVENISSFILKLFMAKFSFLKFQSITEPSEQNSIEDFLQTIQKSFTQNHPSTAQSKLKSSSAFLQLFETLTCNQAIFDLHIVLTVLGFDETYCHEKGKLQPIITKLHKLVSKQIESSEASSTQGGLGVIRALSDEQTMTFLFWKYMSYSSSEQQSQVFVDILVELCNFYSSSLQPSASALFKTMFALQNYRLFFNFLLINFTEQNLLNKNARQTFQKISIILQRFCYSYGEKISIEETDLKRLRKIIKELQKNNDFQGSLFKANMENILDKISQNYL